MPRIPSAPLALAGLALALLLSDAAPALATPPWISVEYPANPHDRDTRGALMVVHTYHHGSPTTFRIRGTAEGLISGRRRSIPLEAVPTARPGVYAVRGSVPAHGAWVVSLSMTDPRRGSDAGASVLVALGPQREVGATRVPADLVDGWMVPRLATAGEVEEMLRFAEALAQTHAALAQRSARGAHPLAPSGAALGLALLLPLAAVRQRRRAGLRGLVRMGGSATPTSRRG